MPAITPFILSASSVIRYVDPVGGSDSNDGLSTSTPWLTWDYARASGRSLGAGNLVLQKGGTVFTCSASPTPNGTVGTGPQSKFAYGGYPRPAKSGLSGDFTNGSRTVTNVTGLTLTEKNCQTRTFTLNGVFYRVGRYVSSSSFELITQFVGSTGTASFEFDEDPWYSELNRLGVYDATWSNDSMAEWTNGAASRSIDTLRSYNDVRNLHYNSSASTNLPMITSIGNNNILSRCSFVGVEINAIAIETGTNTFPTNAIIEGCSIIALHASNAGYGIRGRNGFMQDGIIQNNYIYGWRYCIANDSVTPFGSTIIRDNYLQPRASSGEYFRENGSNSTSGIVRFSRNAVAGSLVVANTTAFTGFESRLLFTDDNVSMHTRIGTVSRVGSDTADVERFPGASSVIKISPSYQDTFIGSRHPNDGISSYGVAPRINVNTIGISLSPGNYSLRIPVNCGVDGGLTRRQLWIEVECPNGGLIKSQDDTDERSSISDWSNYLEITGLTISELGSIFLDVFYAFYDNLNSAYLGPLQYNRNGGGWQTAYLNWTDAQPYFVVPIESNFTSSRNAMAKPLGVKGAFYGI